MFRGKTFFALTLLLGGLAFAGTAQADGTASVIGLYPAAEVPIGAHVTFSLSTQEFTSPTFYLMDSFPGGATTQNLDSAGNFSWTPNQDEVGTHTLTITVSDSQGDSATATQTITVDGAATLAISSLAPGSSVTVGVPVTFAITPYGLLTPAYTAVDSFLNSSMRSYVINASTGAFNWTPITQDLGTHTVTVSAKDVYGNTASAQQQITVLSVPTIAILNLSAGSSLSTGQVLSFAATSTGLVSPAYSLSDSFASVSTSTLAIDPASGKVSWSPGYNDIGVHPLTITASDSSGRSASIVLSIKVVLGTAPAQTTPAATGSQTTTSAQTQNATTETTQTSSPTTKNSPTKTSQPSTSASSSSAPLPAAAVAQTPTSSTNVASPQQVEPPNIAAQVTIPTSQPVESIGGFFISSVVNFFASIFKLF